MKKQNIFQPYDKVALRISVLYMIISALWIFFSDKLLVGDPRVVTYISIGKGWFYTVVVGFFFYFTISRIIKHHNQVECEARVSESNYRRLFETAKDGILLVDFKTGMILDVNPFLVDLLGYSKTDFLEKYLWDVGTFKDVAASKDNFLTLQEKKYVRFEDLPLETKSGKKINVEFVANAYDVEGVTIIQCNIRDITARKKAERDLSEAKISFLSVASHQLRTPLSITKWVLESLIRDKQATPQQTERFNYLVYSNERLINLVNDLLSVTEIDSGKLKVDKKMVDINKLISDLSNFFQVLASARKKIINIEIPSSLKKVYCDPILVYEILQNLLSNAIIYSKEDSKKIEIVAEDRPDDYLISIHNDGVMDFSLVEKISSFDKFARGIGAEKLEPAGTGLGLYIAKRMAEASGGSIWFKSDLESGTTFYLTIIKDKNKK